MFNFFTKDRQPNWYPGQQVVRDRWGTPLNAAMGAREFRPAQNAAGVLNTMRWSLGLY